MKWPIVVLRRRVCFVALNLGEFELDRFIGIAIGLTKHYQ